MLQKFSSFFQGLPDDDFDIFHLALGFTQIHIYFVYGLEKEQIMERLRDKFADLLPHAKSVRQPFDYESICRTFL